uniref:Nucleophosmin n=1 Tax=Caenorhabditis tropicalis TaxID=1561998 RepID=A0A1I7TXR6_9PELO
MESKTWKKAMKKPSAKKTGRPQKEESSSSSDAPVEMKMSEELSKKVAEMMLSIPDHVDVFPPAPKATDPVFPTGRLAKCQCSPSCTKTLPQPEYRFLTNQEAGLSDMKQIEKALRKDFKNHKQWKNMKKSMEEADKIFK